MALEHEPLVSIISFCKNRASTIRRSVDSVLGQSYRNIEFVVQDGASTDGTREILEDYAGRDARLKLISAPDSGPAEAFWKVLHRCEGDFIGTCLSDEELLPGVVQLAVERFTREPLLAAITSDGYWSDEQGNVTGDFIAGEFDFVGYLFSRYCPFWPGSFFRRQALINVGFDKPGWNQDCIEFEIWCRLSTDMQVKYFPGPVSKYAVHAGQASNTPVNFHEHVRGRLALIDNMFSSDGFFGLNERRRLQCKINQLSLFQFHARAYHLKADEAAFLKQIKELSKEVARKGHADALPFHDQQLVQAFGQYLWQRVAFRVPESIRRKIPRTARLAAYDLMMRSIAAIASSFQQSSQSFDERNFLVSSARWLPSGVRRRIPRSAKRLARLTVLWSGASARVAFALWRPRSRRAAQSSGTSNIAALRVYPEVALTYEARGQIEQALYYWQRAEPLGDAKTDALACQAMLKLPTATYADILAVQKRWAERHGRPNPELAVHSFRPFDGTRRIKVGYHCSFMESDTIRFILGKVMAAHDRRKFEIYGFTPVPLSSDMASVFDVVVDTALVKDDDFVRLVRGHEIDVLIELTGFSPGHRFASMATRCAPVQVSNLNHHATSGVPNVDYIISDALCTPMESDAQAYFTEKIYCLPGSLLCYDYMGYSHPSIAPRPPMLTAKTVTFGCFGSGGKINTRLIEVWSALLHKVPGSRIYIRNGQLSSRDNQRYMADRFAWFGICADRLRLEGGTDRNTLLRSYEEVDITLDTWPYCGGNTVAEALWQGVPVVTYLGERFSTRYGASLLAAAGCGDLIAASFSDYVKIAAMLAHDPERLTFLRSRLRAMCQENGLGNSVEFARKLERAFVDMLARSPVGGNAVLAAV